MSRAKKAKDEPVPDRTQYRMRPTRATKGQPLEMPEFGTREEVITKGLEARERGLDPVVEYRAPGAPWAEMRPRVLIEDLARVGLAKRAAGSSSTWVVQPDGYLAISDAAQGDALDFSLAIYSPTGLS